MPKRGEDMAIEIKGAVATRDAAYRGYRLGLEDVRPIAYLLHPTKKRRLKWFKFGFRIVSEYDEKAEPIYALLITDAAVHQGVFSIDEKTNA